MSLEIGQKVKIGNLSGKIKYIGKTQFSPGEWVGVELKHSHGRNDGTVDGVQYFECKPKRGIFLPFTYLLYLLDEKPNNPKIATQLLVNDFYYPSQIEDDLLRNKLYCHSKSIQFFVEERETLTNQVKGLKMKFNSKIEDKEDPLFQSIELDEEIEKLERELSIINKTVKASQEEILNLETIAEELEKDKTTNRLSQLRKEVLQFNKENEETRNDLEKEVEKTRLLEKEKSSLEIDLKFAKSTGERQIQKLNLKIVKRENLINSMERQRKNLLKELGSPVSLFAENVKKYEEQINNLEDELEFATEQLQVMQERKEAIQIEESLAKSRRKEEWMAKLMKRNPKILEMRERTLPLSNKISYSRLVENEPNQVPDLLSQNFILKLIIQHYDLEGKKSIRDYLQKKFAINYNIEENKKLTSKESDLYSLVRLSLRNPEMLWSLNINGEEIEDEDEDEDLDDEIIDETDVSVWNEPKDNPKNIRFDDKKIKELGESAHRNILETIICANKNKLIERLTWDVSSDSEFIKVFLRTHPWFMSIDYVLVKIFQRWHVPDKKEGVEQEEWDRIAKTIKLRIFSLLRTWVNGYFHEFPAKSLRRLENFALNDMSLDKLALGKKVVAVIERARDKIRQPEKQVFKEKPPKPRLPKSIFSPHLKLSDIDELEVARQLTLLQFKLYSKLRTSELLIRNDLETTNKHKVINLTRLKEYFNRLVGYFATEILNPKKSKHRIKVMMRLIKIGEHLNSIKNYEALAAIITAFNLPPIKRLEQTIEEIPKNSLKTLSDLQSIVNKKNNYQNLSKIMKNIWEQNTDPSLPYFGMFLSKIDAIDKSQPDEIDEMINFRKARLLSQVLDQVVKAKSIQYNLVEVEQIQLILGKLPEPPSEKKLNQLSLEASNEGKQIEIEIEEN
ncbi:guanine nucleotide exchange factor [Anaeramoeba flamelloides]|uniref:Guanine nucleotide exchange factor n=1 Tax=Anaeramoeba flamelloides TaxID=1746091 RepID=A0ABQ8ZD91_9EUKA|nr:guanine nucleotide exchange factor [Anaeramoeba flamelloides]